MKVFGNMEFFEIVNILKSSIGYNQKITPSGWISFNAPCCTHINPNHRPDRLKRGGFKISNNRITYHCFNCGFSTCLSYDRKLSNRFKEFMKWLNVDEDDIQKINFFLWKNKSSVSGFNRNAKIEKEMTFNDSILPPNSISLLDAFDKNPDKDTMDKISYLKSRGDFFLDNISKFYSTTSKKDTMNRRIIIPFYWEGKIVGYVGRSIDKKPQKYFGVIPPNYIFNTEAIKDEHRYIVVTEGPFDALVVNGVAVLGDKMSETQVNWLKSKNKKIIVVPDFDGKESKIKEIGLKNNWIIANPEWREGIKDCSDALNEYGRYYTIYSIFRNMKNETD